MSDRSSADVAIALQGVAKHYPLFRGPGGALLQSLGLMKYLPGFLRPRPPVHRALDGVDLVINKGEKVAILGRNGAGKTTLLKLIIGNYEPTAGTVTVNGDVKALMATGLGFHPAFTGMENIRSSLMYNGLSDEALDAAIADVVDFVELGDFLSQPVKTYSLGMSARLQFACATAIHPEIVIVDEVMGAGDTYFNAKCADRVQKLTQSGCTFLLVSHNMAQVIQYCDRAIWIKDGRVEMDGPVFDVVSAYEVYMERQSAKLLEGPLVKLPGYQAPQTDQDETYFSTLSDGRKVYRWPGTPGVKINRISVNDGAEDRVALTSGAPFSFEMDLIAEISADFVCNYLITFWRDDGRRIARLEAPLDGFSLQKGEMRTVRVTAECLLSKGTYHVSFSIYDRKNYSDALGLSSRLDFLARVFRFDVAEDSDDTPIFRYPAQWSLDESLQREGAERDVQQ